MQNESVDSTNYNPEPANLASRLDGGRLLYSRHGSPTRIGQAR